MCETHRFEPCERSVLDLAHTCFNRAHRGALCCHLRKASFTYRIIVILVGGTLCLTESWRDAKHCGENYAKTGREAREKRGGRWGDSRWQSECIYTCILILILFHPNAVHIRVYTPRKAPGCITKHISIIINDRSYGMTGTPSFFSSPRLHHSCLHHFARETCSLLIPMPVCVAVCLCGKLLASSWGETHPLTNARVAEKKMRLLSLRCTALPS